MFFEVNGKTAATAATADHAIFGIWNPSTTKRIRLLELHIFKLTVGAADEPVLRRTSARGTATTTVTPVAANEMEQAAVPQSGFLLDVAYSAQPTLVAGPLRSAIVPAAIGSGLMWVFNHSLEIPAAAGVALTVGTALAFPVSRVTAIVED